MHEYFLSILIICAFVANKFPKLINLKYNKKYRKK